MTRLSPSELNVLKEALHYMHVEELKEICKKLSLSTKGKKGDLIENIYLFLKDGSLRKEVIIPSISKTKQGKTYPLHSTTLILKGSYKNDTVTRVFMKSLVGEHFHFTAFGQDWILKRWIEGNPPTYREFALFWEKEYLARKQRKATPKQEWAYLNFIQNNPEMKKEDLASKWEKERTKQCLKAIQLIKKSNP
jgi:hypothetical protein